MADRYIHELVSGGEPVGTDLFLIERDPAGAQVPRNVTADDLLAWVLANVPVSPSSGAWIPIEQFGAVADGLTDNTEAIQDAVNYAESVGAPGITHQPNDGGVYAFEGRVDMKVFDILGFGPLRSIFRCEDPGAGLDFGAYTDTGKYTGFSGHFKIDGNGLATRQMVIGKRVLATFKNIQSWNADPDPESDSVCMLFAALQNSLIDTCWSGGGAISTRLDNGAANNVFLKGEISLGHKYLLEFQNSDDAPGQFPYTLYNQFIGTILEGPSTTTEHMLYSKAGALNMLRGSPISVNGDILGDGQPTDMVSAVRVEAVDSTQASLIMDDVPLFGGDVIDVGTDAVIGGTFGAARVHVKGGSLGNMPLGGRGVINVETEPWKFASCAQAWDRTGITTVIPRHERRARDYFVAPAAAGVSDVVEVLQVDGESNVRAFRRVDGTTVFGDGTNPTDSSLGRIGAGHVGSITGNIGSSNSAWNQPHLQLGTYHFWVDPNGGSPLFRFKNGAPSSATDGTALN